MKISDRERKQVLMRTPSQGSGQKADPDGVIARCRREGVKLHPSTVAKRMKREGCSFEEAVAMKKPTQSEIGKMARKSSSWDKDNWGYERKR